MRLVAVWGPLSLLAQHQSRRALGKPAGLVEIPHRLTVTATSNSLTLIPRGSEIARLQEARARLNGTGLGTAKASLRRRHQFSCSIANRFPSSRRQAIASRQARAEKVGGAVPFWLARQNHPPAIASPGNAGIKQFATVFL